jgi:hypothetical protein
MFAIGYWQTFSGRGQGRSPATICELGSLGMLTQTPHSEYPDEWPDGEKRKRVGPAEDDHQLWD